MFPGNTVSNSAMSTLCIARETNSLARIESELSSAKGTIINQLMKFVV